MADKDSPAMTNERKEKMALEVGCYVDGHWGQYAAARVITLAHELGYDDAAAIDLASRKLAYMGPSYDAELTLEGENELIDACDDAERYLNENVAAAGYAFGWYDGEFFYWPNDSWEDS